MKNFRTIIPVSKASFEIGHIDNILLLGSCFSDNIGAKLQDSQFHVLHNPLGILYNPLSLSKFLKNVLDRKTYQLEELILEDHYYYHFDYHTQIAHTDANTLLREINSQLLQTCEYLKTTNYLFITLGTAWYYKKEGEVVGNCHKRPAKEFDKQIASIEEIKNSFEDVFRQLKEINPEIKIVFTVSPIRHIKDGFIENQRSKAVLIEAIHQMLNENVSYFPAYEILMDDLRDYQFYKEDMLHPNEVGVNYVWQYFQETYFSEPTKELVQQINQLKKSINHKSLRPKSDAYKEFIVSLKRKVEAFNEHNPAIKPIVF